MGKDCCVQGCSTRSHDHLGRKVLNGIRFFGFPTWKRNQGEKVSDVTRRRRMAWVAAVRRTRVTFNSIPSWMTICSRHFHSGQPSYEMYESHPDWAPSLHLGHKEVKETNPARYERQKRRADSKKPMTSRDQDGQQKETDVKIEIDTAQEPDISALIHQLVSQGTSSTNSDSGSTASTPIKKTVHWISTKPIEENDDAPEPVDTSERTDPCQWIKIEEVEENETSDVFHQFQSETTDNSERHMDMTDIKTEPEDTDASVTEKTAEKDRNSDEDCELPVTFDVEGGNNRLLHEAARNIEPSACEQNHGEASSASCQVPGSDQPATSDKTALTNDPTHHVCDVCSKAFTGSIDLIIHKLTHTSQEPFVCEVCNKTFRQSSTLNEHKLIHTGMKPFVCGVCDQTFRTKEILKSHKCHHTGKKPYICDVCYECFALPNMLKEHQIVNCRKVIKCDLCPKLFFQPDDLQRHKLTVHYRPVSFTCSVCNKTFEQSYYLKQHMLVHTADRPFKCDVCDKSYKRKSHLKNHKLTHTGQKSFICEVCGMCFTLLDNLRNHVAIHSDKKPLMCDVCGRGFRHPCDLKRHLSLIHSKQ